MPLSFPKIPWFAPVARGPAALDTTHLQQDLRRRTVRGGAVTGSAQFVALVLQFGSTMVLARLLSPADFGLIGMVAAITGLFIVFQNMGLAEATIQRQEISHRQVTLLFWINFAVGTAIAVGIAAAAPLIAWVYGEPQVAVITPALAAMFVFSGFAAQHRAIVRRQLRFSAVVVIDLSATFLGMAAGIVAAALGAGVWSLVILNLVTAASGAGLAAAASGWWPGLPRRCEDAKALLGFGGNLTLFDALTYLARNADNFLIGVFIGPVALGFYTKAYGLLILPLRQMNRPIGTVAIPTLSRLQNDPERFGRYYLMVVKLLAYTTIPLTAVLGALADPIVAIVLGPGWEPTADMFRWLAVAGALQGVLFTSGWVLQALGHAADLRNLGLIVSPVYVAAFALGLPWGGEGVAAAFAIAVNLLFLPSMYLGLRRSQVRLGQVLKVLVWPILLALTCFATIHFGGQWLASTDLVQALAVAPVAIVLSLLVIFLLSPWCRRDLRDVLKLAKDLKPARPAAA
jgi:PST family polysaccharide transporter